MCTQMQNTFPHRFLRLSVTYRPYKIHTKATKLMALLTFWNYLLLRLSKKNCDSRFTTTFFFS
jgi:hypothetical protein